MDPSKHTTLQKYGHGCVFTIGISIIKVQLDIAQEIPVLIRRNFTELLHSLLVKDDQSLNFLSRQLETSSQDFEPTMKKIVLKAIRKGMVPLNHLGHIYVTSDDFDYEGMRNQVLRAAQDDFGHFGIEKTLYLVSDHY